MRKLLLAAAAALAMETAALACSCALPSGPREVRATAAGVTRGAFDIVEAEVLTVYDQRRRRGEEVRVHRSLFARAPARFRVDRPGPPQDGACDLVLNAGERRILVLYAGNWFNRLRGRYRIHHLCVDFLMRERSYLDVLLQELRARR
jgi:hypothetical protein